MISPPRAKDGDAAHPRHGAEAKAGIPLSRITLGAAGFQEPSVAGRLTSSATVLGAAAPRHGAANSPRPAEGRSLAPRAGRAPGRAQGHHPARRTPHGRDREPRSRPVGTRRPACRAMARTAGPARAARRRLPGCPLRRLDVRHERLVARRRRPGHGLWLVIVVGSVVPAGQQSHEPAMLCVRLGVPPGSCGSTVVDGRSPAMVAGLFGMVMTRAGSGPRRT